MKKDIDFQINKDGYKIILEAATLQELKDQIIALAVVVQKYLTQTDQTLPPLPPVPPPDYQ